MQEFEDIAKLLHCNHCQGFKPFEEQLINKGELVQVIPS